MKRIFRILGVCFLLTGMLINIDSNNSSNSDSDQLLNNIIALAKADGESGSRECTRNCFESNCDPTWTADHCYVTCGTTSCDFTYAKEK